MNDHADPSDDHDDSVPRKSRLDLEVEEILRKSDNVRPFPEPGSRSTKAKLPPTSPRVPSQSSMTTVMKKALETPLFLALGFAILALMVSSASPLLGTLFALAAVVFVLLPIVQRYRRPSAALETKMWRGRVIDSRSTADSVVESVRQWWRSRQP